MRVLMLYRPRNISVEVPVIQGDPGETLVWVDYQDRRLAAHNLEHFLTAFSAPHSVFPLYDPDPGSPALTSNPGGAATQISGGAGVKYALVWSGNKPGCMVAARVSVRSHRFAACAQRCRRSWGTSSSSAAVL